MVQRLGSDMRPCPGRQCDRKGPRRERLPNYGRSAIRERSERPRFTQVTSEHEKHLCAWR
jgi:hypothetical protein